MLKKERNCEFWKSELRERPFTIELGAETIS